MQAADEAAIQAPYLELEMDKAVIRTVCDFLDLEVADKPAMPCMASRIAYGQEVSVDKLKQVEAAEDFLGSLGFKVLRVRHHGDMARIEIAPPMMDSSVTYFNDHLLRVLVNSMLILLE